MALPMERLVGPLKTLSSACEDDDVAKGTPCWPGDIENTIKEKIGGNSIDIDLQSGVADVTCDSREILKAFAPDIRLLGYELPLELNSREWGGVVTRALSSDNDARRCLQYIYIYLRQLSVISPLWMVGVPMLMSIWAFLVRMVFAQESALAAQMFFAGDIFGLLSYGSHWLPSLATGFVALPITFTGLWPHVMDFIKNPKGSRRCLRSTTLLIPYGLAMWFAPISFWVPAVISIVSLAIGAYWFVGTIRKVPGSHDMDYTPVFIWLRLRRDPSNVASRDTPDLWEVESAAWDNYHYKAIKINRELLYREYRLPGTNIVIHRDNYLTENRRVRLLMANQWHSLFLGSQQDTRIFAWSEKASFLLGSATIVAMAWYLLTSSEFLTTLAFIWLPFLFASFARTAARKPTNLIEDPDEFTKPVAHLCHPKLVSLWNLLDKDARFCIVTKMQYPFPDRQNEDAFFKEFRDEMEDLYTIISNFKYRREHPFRIPALSPHPAKQHTIKHINKPQRKYCCQKEETIEHFCNAERLYRRIVRRRMIKDAKRK